MNKFQYIVLSVSAGFIAFSSSAQVNSRGDSGPQSVRTYKEIEGEEKKEMTRREYKKTFHYQFYRHHEKLVDEYYERMERNAKKYKRLARLMEKPQYSDPSYFGHKRKPKKRPVDKMKLCKECGIRH